MISNHCSECRFWDQEKFMFTEGEYMTDGNAYGYCMKENRRVKKHGESKCDINAFEPVIKIIKE